jgi:type IV pilus assembly protein PilB
MTGQPAARLHEVAAGEGQADEDAAAPGNGKPPENESASDTPDQSSGPPPGLTAPRRRGERARFIGDVLVELDLVEREKVDKAVREGKGSGRRVGEILLETGAITHDVLARALAERHGFYHVDLTVYKPDLSAVNLVSVQAARRFGAVPIGFEEDGALMVALSDPTNVLAMDDLKLMTGREVRPVIASPEDVEALIGRMNRLDEAVSEAIEEDDTEDIALTEVRESADDAPVIKLVNSIIAEAVENRASDVHFEPDGRDMRVRFRVDGVLAETATIPRKMVAGVVSRVKIIADLDIAERRIPQDGRVTLTVENRPVDIRVVTLPRVDGEGIVMRLLDKGQALISLDKLGMRKEARTRFEAAFRQAYGAILVTGPTGSGKSTTLYAALNALNSIEKNILTIEDPVEYQLGGINQIQVSQRAGLTFPLGLRSMLRADPDVIMVGEIRDGETARIAVESALTGHLVLSTLHTNDAPSAITRLTEMDIEPFLTASAIDCVVAQRLARKLCNHCKRAVVLSVEELEAAGFRSGFEIEGYEAEGCSRCGTTGYKGRIGLYEVMSVTDEIRQLAIERSSSEEIRTIAGQQGMHYLRDDGLAKVAAGVTSLGEVSRVT